MNYDVISQMLVIMAIKYALVMKVLLLPIPTALAYPKIGSSLSEQMHFKEQTVYLEN